MKIISDSGKKIQILEENFLEAMVLAIKKHREICEIPCKYSGDSAFVEGLKEILMELYPDGINPMYTNSINMNGAKK